jgi:AcrR family transcriptional regulator
MRHKIMNAARELFASQGYESVTMRSIAEKIEYTPTCIYFHFADKEALIRQICDEDFACFAKELHSDATDPLERLRAQGSFYLKFARKYPNHYRLMFMTPLPPLHHKDDPAKHPEPVESAYASVRQCCAEAIAVGLARPEVADPDPLAQTLWAAVHGVASLYIVKCDDNAVQLKDYDIAGETILNALLRGLFRDGCVSDEGAESAAGYRSETEMLAAS